MTYKITAKGAEVHYIINSFIENTELKDHNAVCLFRSIIMKIFVCQAQPLAGDLEANFQNIRKLYRESITLSADICLFPELMTSGYFAEDLFLKNSFIAEIGKRTEEIVKLTGNTALILPTVILEKDKLYNGVIVAQNKKVIGTTYKALLPNYSIFDEKRYFTSGQPLAININGTIIGIPVCEDIWYPEVCGALNEQGATLFLVPNGSPYTKGKLDARINVVRERYLETGVPVLYCNQATAHDGIVFDGRSFVYDGKQPQFIGKAFAACNKMIEFKNNTFAVPVKFKEPVTQEEEIYTATVFATREYVKQNGFTSVVIGLSGGIDSALVATIAVDALGAENVKTVMMRSKYTSEESIRDANELAGRLGVELIDIDINDSVNAIAKALSIDTHQTDAGITLQNIQSRVRGVMLMAISNNERRLVLTTGNKSEYATGYATLYGDMNGAFNPIKDLYKTEVYKIVRYRNNNLPKLIDIYLNNIDIIQSNIINKAPTAELSHNQKDSDTLPEYDVLDRILELYIEHDLSMEEITKKGFSVSEVSKVINLVKAAEFKRKQSAPGIKISSKNFEKDRRYPISNGYKE
jgi:NAD+ synthase